jgi:hypothetical protein
MPTNSRTTIKGRKYDNEYANMIGNMLLSAAGAVLAAEITKKKCSLNMV